MCICVHVYVYLAMSPTLPFPAGYSQWHNYLYMYMFYMFIITLYYMQVKSLHGLSRFPVLGMLSVGFNDLDWPEVKTLSHIRLVCLTLIGNPKLDNNPHCEL